MSEMERLDSPPSPLKFSSDFDSLHDQAGSSWGTCLPWEVTAMHLL